MFKQRSDTKELLDGSDIPTADLYQNLKELNVINNLLGGYRLTLQTLEKVLEKEKQYVLVDIGCGGGDTLKQIDRWNKEQKFQLLLSGIDLKEDCIAYARQNNAATIDFFCDDYRNVLHHIPKVDIIHACLFCHHLTELQIIELISFCRTNKMTLIINDLERNGFAYYSIKVLTQLFSKSYLVKNDAPLSVKRGFRLQEWNRIIQEASVTNYSITSRWAFRHEIIIYADEGKI